MFNGDGTLVSGCYAGVMVQRWYKMVYRGTIPTIHSIA